MKFRSLSGDIRVALTHGGHTAVIGEEWRELDPMFHADALALGAEVDKGTFTAEKPKAPEAANAKANNEVTHDLAYRNALITMLQRNEDTDFTRDQLPDIRQVSKLVGFQARKEDVYRVFRDMKAEAEAIAAAEAAAESEAAKDQQQGGESTNGASADQTTGDAGKQTLE